MADSERPESGEPIEGEPGEEEKTEQSDVGGSFIHEIGSSPPEVDPRAQEQQELNEEARSLGQFLCERFGGKLVEPYNPEDYQDATAKTYMGQLREFVQQAEKLGAPETTEVKWPRPEPSYKDIDKAIKEFFEGGKKYNEVIQHGGDVFLVRDDHYSHCETTPLSNSLLISMSRRRIPKY